MWLPVLNMQDRERLQKNAHRYAKDIPEGPRVTHYSDPEAFMGKKYGPILGIPYGAPAWDVYLAFGADVRWGDSAPVPTHWELLTGGGDDTRLLNGPRFGGEVGKLLTKASK